MLNSDIIPQNLLDAIKRAQTSSTIGYRLLERSIDLVTNVGSSRRTHSRRGE